MLALLKGALAVGFVSATTALLMPRRQGAPPPPSPTPQQLLIGAAEIALTPEGIAASGLTGSVQAIMTQLSGSGELLTLLATKRSELSTASSHVTSLFAQMKASSSSNQELHAEYETALAGMHSLQADIAAEERDLFEAVTEGLSSEPVATLNIFRGSRGQRVPPEFRVKSRTKKQWHDIEVALIAEKRSQRLGTTLATNYAELLASVRAEPEVIQAATSLGSDLSGVQQVFDAETHPQE